MAIAKAKKPHNIGEALLNPVVGDLVRLMCGDANSEKVKEIPVSAEIVKRRTDMIARDCEESLVSILKNTKFSIQLD